MNFFTVIIIAVGLAMDAFAVSIVCGGGYKRLRVKHALRIAVFFGGFQAFMPLVGALAGLSVQEFISGWDHWLAFVLLVTVGGKMICESFKIKSVEKKLDPTSISVLLLLSVATSIDALAVGITLPIVTGSVLAAAVIIGVVTFILSYFGVYVGKKGRHFFENKIEAIGGLVLIGIGVKILIEHLFL